MPGQARAATIRPSSAAPPTPMSIPPPTRFMSPTATAITASSSSTPKPAPTSAIGALMASRRPTTSCRLTIPPRRRRSNSPTPFTASSWPRTTCSMSATASTTASAAPAAKPASSTGCTTSPSTARGTSSRPRSTTANACRNSARRRHRVEIASTGALTHSPLEARCPHPEPVEGRIAPQHEALVRTSPGGNRTRRYPFPLAGNAPAPAVAPASIGRMTPVTQRDSSLTR